MPARGRPDRGRPGRRRNRHMPAAPARLRAGDRLLADRPAPVAGVPGPDRPRGSGGRRARRRRLPRPDRPPAKRSRHDHDNRARGTGCRQPSNTAGTAAPAAGSTTGARRSPGSGPPSARRLRAATCSSPSSPSTSASRCGRCGRCSCSSSARIRHRPGREIPADRRAGARRLGAAAALHVRGRQIRRAQLDGLQRGTADRTVHPCGDRARTGRLVQHTAHRRARSPASAAATSPPRWRTSTRTTPSGTRGGHWASTRAPGTSAWPPCSWSGCSCSPPPGRATRGWCPGSTSR